MVSLVQSVQTKTKTLTNPLNAPSAPAWKLRAIKLAQIQSEVGIRKGQAWESLDTRQQARIAELLLERY